MTQRLLVWSLLIALVAGLPVPAWAFSFSVEPARVQLAVPAGKRRGTTVTVDNSKADQPVHLRVSVHDVVYLPDGTNDFPPPGSTAWSCATWLRVTPEELDIPAGTTAEVRVSAVAPPDAAGGYYAVIFFETTPSYAAQGIGINFRLGALTEVVIPNTARAQAKLARLAFQPPREIRVEIFNEGNVLVRPTGKIKIFDAQNKSVAKLEFNPDRLGVLPKTLRAFVATLEQPLPKGTYHLRTELDYGTKYLLAGELPITVE